MFHHVFSDFISPLSFIRDNAYAYAFGSVTTYVI